MPETEQQASQPKREFLTTAGPWAETLSKAVAGIVVALYASGFLIVSLYHSRFGFVGTNPFRPRVLAAGAWFFFFTAIPISFAVGLRKVSWFDVAKNAYSYWIGLFGVSLSLNYLLFQSSPDTSYFGHGKWTWLLLLAILGAVIALDVLSKKKAPQWIAAILSVSVVLYQVALPTKRLLTDHYFDSSSLTLWFFAITLIVKLEIEVRTGRRLAEFGEWSKPLAVLFGLLLLFSREVYPHLKTSWGGGTPANITMYFTKDSLLTPNKATQAQLIEESDEGFYIVGPNESKAVFVPRSAVALIYFSDKPADSPMLQGNKVPPP
jgi:hypothetical protein